jgi:hypothetical protein
MYCVVCGTNWDWRNGNFLTTRGHNPHQENRRRDPLDFPGGDLGARPPDGSLAATFRDSVRAIFQVRATVGTLPPITYLDATTKYVKRGLKKTTWVAHLRTALVASSRREAYTDAIEDLFMTTLGILRAKSPEADVLLFELMYRVNSAYADFLKHSRYGGAGGPSRELVEVGAVLPDRPQGGITIAPWE